MEIIYPVMVQTMQLLNYVFPVSESNIEVSWTSFPTGADQVNSPIITNLAPGVYFYNVDTPVLNLVVMKVVQLKLTEPDPIELSQTHSDYKALEFHVMALTMVLLI